MKRGLKVFFGLVSFCAICLPVFGQPSSKSIETVIMESFDSAGAQEYLYDGKTYSWDWAVNSSRFVAEGYPKTGYYEGIPNSLKQLNKGKDFEPKVFGIKTAYNRKGDNWFEIYPSKDDKPYDVPFIGNVSQIDFWVWGSNYNYYLEVLLRDATGRVHVLPAGSLAFNGWKNIIVNIPGWLQQHSHLRSGPETMSFVGFRVRSDAEEYVDDFVIFFDQIKYTTNPLSYIFDGYELKEVDFGDSDSSEDSETAEVE